MSPTADLPDLVPVLSAGRHRNPRKGACFMEMASYLAGEKWSDHPVCTHPLLASLARMVNDCLSDEDRPRIAGFIPDVVGLTSDDLQVDVAIAIRAAAATLPIAPAVRQNVMAVGLLTAATLPIAPAVRQNVMAVGLLTSQRMLRTLGGDHPDLEALCHDAFVAVPEAHAWALRYARDSRTSERTFRRQTAPHIVAYAVEGIAVACVPDPATELVNLLHDCIRDTARRVPAPQHEPAAAERRQQVPSLR